MKSHCLLLSLPLVFVATLGFPQSQSEVQPQPENSIDQPAPLRLTKISNDAFEAEAWKQNIEGTVSLALTVDATGQVLEAAAIGGTPELFQAAVDDARHWQFEPPDNAPVVTTAEVANGHPKECLGAISVSGEVASSGQLRDKDGHAVAVWTGNDPGLPSYPVADRKGGVAGTMAFSLALNYDGKVKDIGIVKSLSPHLDESAIQTVRAWRFKPQDQNADLDQDLRLEITYRPMCGVRYETQTDPVGIP